MTIIQIQQILREAVIAAARSKFGVELEQVAAEIPPKTELGDLAFPVAFELAKQIKQATGDTSYSETFDSSGDHRFCLNNNGGLSGYTLTVSIQ